MGPVALFDKSFLQSLSLDESTWFDHFFYPTICPLFYVETLADLAKNSSAGRVPEDLVRTIADKTPVLAGGPCMHHRTLCIANLMGHPVPMNGQVPRAGGRIVKGPDGKRGVVYDHSPEAEAFARWQTGKFDDVERKFAAGWRKMLTTLDLTAIAEKMRAVGIDPKQCNTIEKAHAIASALVHQREKPFDQMALLFTFLEIPPELQRDVLQRWSIDQYRPLAHYAPYAAHVLVVELFFQIALAANLVSADRPSNRIDIAYLFYLPFSMVFISSDKLHRRCAPAFLRRDQEFVWGPDLKTELTRQNTEFAKLPASELEQGLMKFAREPIGAESDLLIRLFDAHTPGWRRRAAEPVTLTPEAQKRLVDELCAFSKAPTDQRAVPADVLDLDRMSIERRVPKRKGNWWLLPKDLKADEDDYAD